ncbi:hypothetical protein SLS56_007543 [Neofusicoccum ribis]|uniref:Uncharacterized protein n=1 Tax=Neofusicoccum ribis TaxID=45134 RepID=A0ABR3SMK5_9PEZI
MLTHLGGRRMLQSFESRFLLPLYVLRRCLATIKLHGIKLSSERGSGQMVPMTQRSNIIMTSLINIAFLTSTDSSAPYCVDWDYDFITTTMKAYGCDVSAFTGTVERTYSGQDTYDISSYLTSVAEFSFPTVFVTQTQIVSAGLTSGTAASSSHGTTKKKSHLGAIVGGVVGGLAALALLAAAVIFILFKKRRDKKRAAAAASAAAFQQSQQQPPPPPPMAYGPPGGPGPNDYKPPPMGVPPPQQQQQQYGAPPPQMQQPGNTMSFYAPPPPPAAQSGDIKHEYSQQSVSSVPGTPGPYSPPLSPSPLSPSPLSPSPQYSPPAGQPQQHQWNPNVPQIDGTPVHRNSEGNPIHEAP